MMVAWRVHLEPCGGDTALIYVCAVQGLLGLKTYFKKVVLCWKKFEKHNIQYWSGIQLLPAGQREPRTWEEGCRGTAPSAPSSPGQSGVSAAEHREGLSLLSCIDLTVCFSVYVCMLHLRRISHQTSPSSVLSWGIEKNDA